MPLKPVLTGLSLLALFAGVSACSPTVNNRGYIPEERLISAIQPGVDDQTSVRQMLGSPSLSSMFDNQRWYYVSRTTEEVAFFRPKTIEGQVVEVAFNDKGVVSTVSKIPLSEARSISPSSDKTPSRGRELGFWEQIFGNIGRFSGGGGAAGGPAGAGGGGGR
ncbi:outer membrane protein assembly factor BamE [Govanella unica]|uniref:Outer membrane protein assembly factor BamE n=1 Tax=Govanella unica TaxID=2975056 RepID=A0A9X3TZ20_9PROT|nr:outer membrane protein assembly factor BamE [Govania unica]MDA5194094.1 outer membrane protein assembly factor BamE [Govania unica]